MDEEVGTLGDVVLEHPVDGHYGDSSCQQSGGEENAGRSAGSELVELEMKRR